MFCKCHGLNYKYIKNEIISLTFLTSKAITEENVQWNEEIGEWQLKCVAYTGNNMRKVSQLIHSYYLWQ